MSLIQQALEKSDGDRKKNKVDSILKAQEKTTAKSNADPVPVKSSARTKQLYEAAQQLGKFDPKISPQAPSPIIPQPVAVTPVKSRPYNKTRYFVVGFMLLFFTIALAACYFLVLEMSSSWNPRESAVQLTARSTEVPERAPQKKAAGNIETLEAKITLKDLPYKLSGITASGGTQYALINNKILQVGDSIDNFSSLEAIGSKQVTILFHGNEVILEM